MKKVSTYQFLKDLGQKIPQKVLENEYNRVYKNLIRSVKGYAKRGVSSKSFFQIPTKPKKITQGSLNKLQKSVTEWKYYTGRKLSSEEYNILPKNISRAYQHNISDNARRIRNLTKISNEVDEAIKQYRQKLDQEMAEKNKDNEDYKKMIAEGYDNIPSIVANEAINLYNLATKAYKEASESLAKGDHSRNWWFVQLKAETSLSAFSNIGLMEYSSLFSFNLRHCGTAYEYIYEVFDGALYDSDQLDKDERFSNMINAMTQEPKHMNARGRQEYADIRENLGLT